MTFRMSSLALNTLCYANRHATFTQYAGCDGGRSCSRYQEFVTNIASTFDELMSVEVVSIESMMDSYSLDAPSE